MDRAAQASRDVSRSSGGSGRDPGAAADQPAAQVRSGSSGLSSGTSDSKLSGPNSGSSGSGASGSNSSGGETSFSGTSEEVSTVASGSRIDLAARERPDFDTNGFPVQRGEVLSVDLFPREMKQARAWLQGHHRYKIEGR
jgi:hypothetical protein